MVTKHHELVAKRRKAREDLEAELRRQEDALMNTGGLPEDEPDPDDPEESEEDEDSPKSRRPGKSGVLYSSKKGSSAK